MQEFIELHLSEPITLKQLAEVASYSRSRFRILFRNAAGCSPHQYVMRQRMEKAIDLLQSTDRTLVSIAVDCGFSDQSHLIRLCKRRTGVTPSRMRQMKEML